MVNIVAKAAKSVLSNIELGGIKEAKCNLGPVSFYFCIKMRSISREKETDSNEFFLSMFKMHEIQVI